MLMLIYFLYFLFYFILFIIALLFLFRKKMWCVEKLLKAPKYFLHPSIFASDLRDIKDSKKIYHLLLLTPLGVE